MSSEQIRLGLLIALSFVSLMIWEAWQRDYGAPPAPAPTAATQTAPVAQDTTPAITKSPGASLTAQPATPAIPDTGADDTFVTIQTDVLSLRINLTGAVIEQASLRQYPTDGETDASPYALLNNSPARYFVHQSGLKATVGDSADHHARFSAAQDTFTLTDGTDTLAVDLAWQSPAGVRVTKTYRLARGSYEIDVAYSIENAGAAPWSYNHYDQLQRMNQEQRQYFIQTFTGAALSTPEKRYEKHSFDDLVEEPLGADVKDGWAAILEHYFVSAIVPTPGETRHFYSTIIGEQNYAVGYYGPVRTVAPGDRDNVRSRLYIGPKLQNVLERVAPGLELTVDYGVLWFIGKILFWTMVQMHALTGNWGWAIILLTCIVKLVFFPLSAAGYRSMAGMRKIQPRLVALRERYQNDRAALNQAMMDLYKKEKINPLGGCLPILIQIPVFIALYWVILESVELRQAPWILWIRDLSIKDPWFVLPVLMTISMWLQSKLNPAPVDPIQARVMQIMPFAFGIFFAFFPSGLVLYWFVNNCLSIGQQWFITRAAERAP